MPPNPAPLTTFALPPLANALRSREGVDIRPLDPATGGYGVPVTRSYSGIDLDIWARGFLGDVDRFLGPRYAVPALALAPAAMAEAMAARDMLADAIADRLLPVLQGGAGEPGSPLWAAARAVLHRRLQSRLSEAYAATAVVVLPGGEEPDGEGPRVALSMLDETRQRTMMLGSHLIPIPLRSYPRAPTLLQMEASALAAPPGDLEAALQWCWRVVYRHASAAQDRIEVAVRFNSPGVRPIGQPATPARDRDLFRCLAQHAEIAVGIWGILAGFDDPGDADRAVLAKAVETFAALTGETARAWPQGSGAQVATLESRGGTAESDRFRLTRVDAETIVLQRLCADGAAPWPAIAAIMADGGAVALKDRGPQADARLRIHDFPKGTVQAVRDIALAFAPLHLARYRSASAGLRIERNAALLGADAAATRAPFVYRTPEIAAADSCFPMIARDGRIEIGPWTDDPATNPFGPVLKKILGEMPCSIAIVAYHERRLHGGAPADAARSTAARTPLLLTPPHVPDDAEVPKLIAEIGERCARIGAVGGTLLFEIKLYAADAATDAATGAPSGVVGKTERPLLVLEELASPMPG